MFIRFSPHRFMLGSAIFVAAYMTTITVHAQGYTTPTAPDRIELTSGNRAFITGTVKEVDDGALIIDNAGRDVKIDLDDVKTGGDADAIFESGMWVEASGEMKGDDFGTPIFKASNIRAVEKPAEPAVAEPAPTMLEQPD